MNWATHVHYELSMNWFENAPCHGCMNCH